MKQSDESTCTLLITLVFIIFVVGFYVAVTNSSILGLPAPFSDEDEKEMTEEEIMEEMILDGSANVTTGVIEILPAE